MEQRQPTHQQISVFETWIFRWDQECNDEEVIYLAQVTVKSAGGVVQCLAAPQEDTPPMEPTKENLCCE
jgi:hypothetical protein